MDGRFQFLFWTVSTVESFPMFLEMCVVKLNSSSGNTCVKLSQDVLSLCAAGESVYLSVNNMRCHLSITLTNGESSKTATASWIASEGCGG